MEMAVGLLAVVSVVLSLVVFVDYMTTSLEIQNHLRAPSGPRRVSATIKLDRLDSSGFAAETLFGTRNLHVREPSP